MRSSWLVLATCVVLVTAETLPTVAASPFLDDDDTLPSDEDYNDNSLDRFLQTAQK